MKRHLGARNDEIRVIIASTEWNELLVPFSRFAADTTISVTGVQLKLEPSGNVSAKPVFPLTFADGRYLAPWHELNFYLDKKSLSRGIKSYEVACSKKGIRDYVMAVLRAPRAALISQGQKSRASVIGELGRTMIDDRSMPDADTIVKNLPRYRYVLYFAMQRLSRAEYLRLIAKDPDLKRQANEILPVIEEDGEEAALNYLHNLLSSAEPRPHHDTFEIGYPAKFKSRILDEEGWSVQKILRYGVFHRNVLLTDDDLIEELSGSHGHTGQRFKRTISVSNRAQMSAARTDLAQCLKDNPVWQAHIQRHLAEIEREFPKASIDISVFNPCTGVMTIFFGVARPDGVLYVPSYGITVNNKGAKRLYYGTVSSDGKPQTFKSLLKKLYEGDLWPLLFTLTWGGYENRDTEVLETLGLAYRSYRCDATGKKRTFFELKGERWQACDKVMPLQQFYEWANANETLVHNICVKIGRRYNEHGVIDGSSHEKRLESLVDLARAQRERVYWCGSLEKCDLCKCTLSDEKFMIDGGIKGHGAWANMCADCFNETGRGIGWGMGQLYLKQPKGWLLVAGFPPDNAS